MRDDGGSVRVESPEDGGARFVLALPGAALVALGGGSVMDTTKAVEDLHRSVVVRLGPEAEHHKDDQPLDQHEDDPRDPEDQAEEPVDPAAVTGDAFGQAHHLDVNGRRSFA